MEIPFFFLSLQKKVLRWADTFWDLIPNFFAAILVIFVFIFMSRQIEKIVCRIMSRTTDNASLVTLSSRVIRIAVMAAGLFVALSILGLDKAVTSLLAGAGIVGLALGFAFQDLTANFLSGTFIAIQQPIRVGDVVETNGYFGQVKAIKLRSTVIDNFSGQYIEIPSKDIFQKPIVNFSKSGQRRMQLNWSVDYNTDLQKAQDIALETVKSLPFLEADKPVEFHYQSFGPSNIPFLMWFWLDETKAGPPQAMSDAIKAVKQAFEANGIVTPLPTQTLELKSRDDLLKPLTRQLANGN